MASCLLDLTDLTVGLGAEHSVVNEMILAHQFALERSSRLGPYHDLETQLQSAVKTSDEPTIRELIRQSDTLFQQQQAKTHITRILWKIVVDAPPDLADLVLACPAVPFDYDFVDDINGRTCLHEAAMAGATRLVRICIEKGVRIDRSDVYGENSFCTESIIP